MRVSAKVDYAVRAAIELAAAGSAVPVKGDRIARAQGIPLKFLENTLGELKHAGLLRSQRGSEGGYWLARPADLITIADVIRAVEGPLASIRGEPPETTEYVGRAEPLATLWIAIRASIRSVLELVTLADVASGRLPAAIRRLGQRPGGLGHALALVRLITVRIREV